MKKLVTIIAALLISVSAAANVSELLERSGTAYMLNTLPEQFQAGFEQGLSQAGMNEEIATDAGALAAQTFQASVLIKSLTAELEAKLSGKDIQALMAWYETPLALKITEMENRANDPGQAERIAASMDSLLADQPRLDMAKQIESVLDATEQGLQIARGIQQAMLTAMLRDLDVTQQDAIMAQANAALDGSRGEMQKYVLASIVGTYETLDDKELQTYVEFLEQPSSRRFYQITQDAMAKDLAVMVGSLGSELVTLFKSKLTPAEG